MRITRIETIPVCVPIKPELAIRSGRGGAHLVSPFLLVKIHTDEGLVGVGEASCTPRWSGEDQVTAAHVINRYFAPLLVGEAVDDVARLYDTFASAVAGNYFTKAAVEMALWDILGKARGEPVWQIAASHPGGARRGAGSKNSSDPALIAPSSVPIKWSVSGADPAKAAEIAGWALAHGFQAMKVKVGIEPDADAARVHAVRKAVGRRVKLGVDANGGWPTPQIAIDAINRLYDECGIYFAEQPVPPDDHEAMAVVRRKVPVPIIADESIYTLSDAKMLARAESADVFSVYVGKAGGIGPALEIARFAQSAGIACTIGSNLELGVATAAMIHLAWAAPAIDAATYPCDIIGPLFYEDDILIDPLPLSGGTARAHERSGLGIELDNEKIEAYRVR